MLPCEYPLRRAEKYNEQVELGIPQLCHFTLRLGEEHPDTLRSLHNLALTLRDQRDLPGAARLIEAELEIRRRVLGKERPDPLTLMIDIERTLIPDLGQLSPDHISSAKRGSAT